MLAHAFLAVVRADEHTHRPTPDDLIPLSCNEICRLFIALVIQARPRRGPPACLVRVVPPPSGTLTHQPLPAAIRIPAVKITIYSWNISGTSLNY